MARYSSTTHRSVKRPRNEIAKEDASNASKRRAMDELDRELTKKARHDSTMPEHPNNFDEPEVAASAEIETTSTKSSDCDATENLDSAKLKADFEESEEERREWKAKGYTLEAANDKLKEALKKVNGTQASISSKQSQEAKNAMRKFENDAKGK